MAKCGHVNKHSLGVDRKPDNLACTLEKGHEGNHSALHFESSTQLSPMLSEAEQNKYNIIDGDDGKTYYEGYIERHWTDDAGIPASEIKPRSPGEQLINADHLFGVGDATRMKDMQNEIDELRGLVKDLVGDLKETKKKGSS
jgi:hypothetical protein